MSIAIARNVTVDLLVPYLRYAAYRDGFAAEIRMGEFDTAVQEALDLDGRPFREVDAVLVFTPLAGLSENLWSRFASLGPTEIEAEIAHIHNYVSKVISGIRRQTDAVVLWHGFETPVQPAFGAIDATLPMGQVAVVRGLNDHLRAELAAVRNAFVVDMELIRARSGCDTFYDLRHWHLARGPWGREAFAHIAEFDFRFLRALKGRARKCLVLDCDNVLWGGIVGEDGLSGIRIGHQYPGLAYRDFQAEVLNLYNRGVILAICSRNNEEDVIEVLRDHPDMLLREEHFAAMRVNWGDKAQNIVELAAELNIGLDSMVFVDDSDYEVARVREALPEVSVLHLPPQSALSARDRLAACGLFDTLTFSDEDRRRGRMYRAEAARSRLRGNVQDLGAYLASLDLVVAFRVADAMSIPRIAQLTQKTNQFNLTTRRYGESDIEHFAKDAAFDVFYVTVTDRFGDYGIVGVVIIRYADGTAEIDTLLLSCRVLGRGVEDAILYACVKAARARGAHTILGRYLPTRKNAQVAEFFPNHGFAADGPGSWVLADGEPIPRKPDHLQLLERMEGTD